MHSAKVGYYNAIESQVHQLLCVHIVHSLQTPGELPSLTYAVPAAAGLAGVVLSFVLSPFELIKVSHVLHGSHSLCCLSQLWQAALRKVVESATVLLITCTYSVAFKWAAEM